MFTPNSMKVKAAVKGVRAAVDKLMPARVSPGQSLGAVGIWRALHPTEAKGELGRLLSTPKGCELKVPDFARSPGIRRRNRRLADSSSLPRYREVADDVARRFWMRRSPAQAPRPIASNHADAGSGTGEIQSTPL